MGMNQHLFSWSGGNLYRHDTGATLMNFYGEQGSALVNGVFNDSVLENKLFKTIMYEAEEAWDIDLVTDLQQGYIEDGWFDEKEGQWYSFVRTDAPEPNFLLRDVSGIGNADTVDSTDPMAVVITFASGVSVGTMISIGDSIYFGTTPTLAGVVTAVTASSVTVDTTTGTIPSASDLILYYKSQLAESHGVLGRVCEFTITTDSTEEKTLFSVGSEYLKSYPGL